MQRAGLIRRRLHSGVTERTPCQNFRRMSWTSQFSFRWSPKSKKPRSDIRLSRPNADPPRCGRTSRRWNAWLNISRPSAVSRGCSKQRRFPRTGSAPRVRSPRLPGRRPAIESFPSPRPTARAAGLSLPPDPHNHAWTASRSTELRVTADRPENQFLTEAQRGIATTKRIFTTEPRRH